MLTFWARHPVDISIYWRSTRAHTNYFLYVAHLTNNPQSEYWEVLVELAVTSSWEQLYISTLNHIGGWKLAMVRVFTSQKLANSWWLNIYQYTTESSFLIKGRKQNQWSWVGQDCICMNFNPDLMIPKTSLVLLQGSPGDTWVSLNWGHPESK